MVSLGKVVMISKPAVNGVSSKEEMATSERMVAAASTGDDASIEAALTAGDYSTALSLCSRYHARAIGRVCMALVGSQSEAEDLAQDTLLSAHDGFAGWRREGSVRAWLLGIARRKCARHLETRARQSRKLALVANQGTSMSSDELALQRQRAERARAALEQVRPSEREALILRYNAELSFQEVGLACGIDEATARKRVSRGIARLRDLLQEEEQT